MPPGKMSKINLNNNDIIFNNEFLGGTSPVRDVFTSSGMTMMQTSTPSDLRKHIFSFFLKHVNNDKIRMNKYRESGNGNYAVCYFDKNITVFCDKAYFKKKCDNVKKEGMRVKYHKYNCYRFANISVGDYHPQIGLLEIYRKCKQAYYTTDYIFRQTITEEMFLIMIDLLRTVMELRDQYLSFSKFVTMIMSIYTMVKRTKKLYTPQTSDSELLLGLMAMGFPAHLVKSISTFTVLTGKRIFDADILQDIMYKLFQFLKEFFEYLFNDLLKDYIHHGIKDFILNLIDKCSGNFLCYKMIKDVTALYTKYMRDQQAIFDINFRESVVQLNDRLKSDPMFLAYLSSNKYASQMYGCFKEGLVKSIEGFTASRRDEPLCIIFEGEAGSGKSALMNSFVDLLRKNNRTVYCHSVPSTNDAKDFYDDYENQEVFVMDDIGQQGKSQWRTLINFVSPVKYPLPCASASKKNTKFFNSKVILATTNHLRDLTGFTSADCITEPEALFRRCHCITVNRLPNADTFTQAFKYYKFDHIDTKKWENALLHHFSDAPNGLTTHYDCKGNESIKALAWFWNMFKHLESRHYNNNNNLLYTESQLQDILDDKVVYQGQFYNCFSVFSKPFVYLTNGKHIVEEWFGTWHNSLSTLYDDAITTLHSLYTHIVLKTPLVVKGALAFMTKYPQTTMMLGCAIVYMLTKLIFNNDKGESIEEEEAVTAFNKALTKVKEDLRIPVNASLYAPQSEGKLDVIRKHSKLIVLKEDALDRSKDKFSQAVVSGSFILLPMHLSRSNIICDIYHSFEHFKNNHKEMENINISVVKTYPVCDLAIYKINNIIPLYKKCHSLFKEVGQISPELYLVNSIGILPIILGSSAKFNEHNVTYTSYCGEHTFNHSEKAGIQTPYSAAGACGTMLVDKSGMIKGFHVAGTTGVGFCVIPSLDVANDIRSIMLGEIQEVNYDIDDRINSDISGVRLRYNDGDIKVNRTLGETSFKPTIFAEHTSMTKLHQDLNSYEELRYKSPPNFKAKGNPNTLLKEISKKSMKHQGFVTQQELNYIDQCLSSLMVEFDDLSDHVTSFGNEEITAINKDSSNGYGCLPKKQDYFDFDNKIMLPTMIELRDKFKEAANNEIYDYNLFLTRETFKDEIRLPHKVDKPRTFRVMPLGHIWWTKKICGKLIPHFKSQMHHTGISVGFNPYKDFDIIAKKLLKCEVTGDIDFAEWDGSIMATFMDLICDVFLKYYKGDNEKVLRYLFITMSRSFVLCGDELWATTHGLPSGTWLTLLINCLLNKCLTALVIYRNKQGASVDDFYDVVDYVMGDDKLIGASGHMKNVFNLHTINDVASSLGMKCTNGDKSPISRISQPFDKLTFVKRSFYFHPKLGRYVGALSRETLYNTLRYYDSDKDYDVVMQGKAVAVQIEAWLHGDTIYDMFYETIEEVLPFSPLLTEQRIKRIMDTDEGYKIVLNQMGKDISYLM